MVVCAALADVAFLSGVSVLLHGEFRRLTSSTVRSKHNLRFYAIKVLGKEKIVRMKQESHTRNEQLILQAVQHPFIINLWGTFQDTANLYMVMDFVPGGELFTLLRRSNVSPPLQHMLSLYSYSISALPRPCRQILCRRSCACAELSALKRHHLSRSQTRKHSPELRRSHQDRRFRLREALHDDGLDAVRHARLSCARGELP